MYLQHTCVMRTCTIFNLVKHYRHYSRKSLEKHCTVILQFEELYQNYPIVVAGCLYFAIYDLFGTIFACLILY